LVAAVVGALVVLAWPRPMTTDPGATGLARFWAVGLAIWLGWRVMPPFWRAARHPTPVHLRTAVRAGILSLVLVDGVIAASYAGIIYSLAVLATGVVAWWLARLFAVT